MAKDLIEEIGNTSVKSIVDFSPTELNKIKVYRWKARYDPVFLGTRILRMDKLITEFTHGPLLRHLQQFPKPTQRQFNENDIIVNGQWSYKPIYENILQLPGPRDRLILYPRGSGKCLDPRQLVLLESGQYLPAENLSVGDKILGTASEDSFVSDFTKVTGLQWFRQECFRLKFWSGRELIVSHNHPFRVWEGWKTASDLTKGDYVAVLNTHPEPENARYLPESELVGWLIGDGSMSKGNCMVTNHSGLLRMKITIAAARAGVIGIETKDGLGVRVNEFRDRLRELGLWGLKSGDKFIPNEFFSASTQSIKELLYGLYMSDGCAEDTCVTYTTKSKVLAEGIQKLLLRLGIVAKVSKRVVSYNGQKFDFWLVSISDRLMVDSFFKQIPWDKSNRYKSADQYKVSTNRLPPGWFKKYPGCAKRYNSAPGFSKIRGAEIAEENNIDELRYLCTDAVFWDEVISCEPVGERDTIGVETASKTLAVDNILTHNTTLNCELGTIHWLLNYPEISIAIFQASIKKSRDILDSIKQHFVDNPIFRAIFPEYCPPIGAKEFGTQDQFTTPARNLYFRRSRREESVMTAALEAGLTGYHFEVMKFSDVVTSDNTLTEDQIMKVIDLFDKSKYQSISAGLYWRDVEGTRYHFSDLYGHILNQYSRDIKNKGKSPWSIFVGGCWVKDVPERKWVPEEIEAPNKLDANGKRISVFPELLPLEILERQEEENKGNFLCQMENNPKGGEDGRELFPDITKRVITAAQFKTQVNPAYNVIMVDSAQTDSVRANHTAILCGTVDRFGRLYITKILYGKYLPDELMNKIVAACDQFKPLYLILEKSNFNEGLMPGIKREWDLYPHHIPEVKLVPIDNQRKKQLKIKEALQPAYARADYRFVVEWIEKDAWDACVREHTQFPKSLNDDILDALTAFYEARTWFGREFDRAVPTGGLSQQEFAFMQHAGIQFLDWDSTPQPANLLTAGGLADYYKRTGGL